MNCARDLSSLLDLIAHESARLLEADRASIFLLDREKDELWSKIALGSDEILHFDSRLGIAGAAAKTGQMINVQDAYQDPRFLKAMDIRTGYKTQSVLATPLQNLEGETIGTFEVLNKKGGPFTNEDEEVAKSFAAQVAIAIETAQRVQELRQHREKLLDENTQLWKEVVGKFSTQNIIGTSERVQAGLRLIEQIRDSSVNVLITGESGTGKELLARAIHYNSPRARRRLVALNCAALPESLVESELFGIEKGVATGVERRIGKFEEVDGGTLFLDEVGDLSLTSQAKILRVLQEREIEHVGGRKAIPVDVRILAATNKDLEAEIEKKAFREDLYYRLKVIHISTPPLREIQDDIPHLANYFLAKYFQEVEKDTKKLTPEALRCLVNHDWPGNIRELENEMRRVVVLAQGNAITEMDLSETIQHSQGNLQRITSARSAKETEEKVEKRLSLKKTVEEVERRLILEALQNCHQNQLQAAKELGLSRQGLIKKMKRFGIKTPSP
jgi:Nif-specific regulatory protein